MGKKNKKEASHGKHAAKSNVSSEENRAEEDTHLTPDEQGIQVPPKFDEAEAVSAAETMPDDAIPSGENPFAAFESSYETLSKKKRKSRKALKVAGIVVGSLLGLLLIAYIGGCFFFIDRFWPNTTIGRFDVSLKTQAEAEPILEKEISNYQLSVSGQGMSFVLSAKDTDLSFDEQAIVSSALDSVKPWMWPFELFKSHDESDKLTATYGKSGLAETIAAKVDEFNATATQPTNATIAYDATTKKFNIVPEAFGTALDANSVTRAIDGAIISLSPTVQLTQQELVYPLVGAENEALKNACNSANSMIATNLVLTMGGSTVTELGPDIISPWIHLGDDLNIVFDEGALNAWIDGVVNGCNTIGSERTYTRPDGKVVTIAGGSYGWEVDGDALRNLIKDNLTTGQAATLDVPVVQAGTGFTGIGGRDWGNRYCDIDLSEQYARYYDDSGALIWESPIISGSPDGRHNTPTGVYMVNWGKASPSKLVGEPLPGQTKPEYETVVTYWIPFVGNAIGLHDATWQPSFGGTMYANGYGSHGCVNLPYSAAQNLYNLISIGDPVICHW